MIDLPAEVRARLKSLRIQARRPAAGRGLGQHAGRNRGAGLEFAQYRAYEPGDEPRRVDWRLYARSDRFFVRDATRDSPLTLWLLIDVTASMAQADADYSKLDAARKLAACLIEVALRQGDGFGLLAIGGNGVALVPAGSGSRHRDRMHFELTRLASSGNWPTEPALLPVWERIHSGDMVVVLSDDFDDACVSLVERLAAARREVLSIGLISVEERDFPFDGGCLFVDSESGDRRRADAGAARQAFIADFGAARRALVKQLAASGVRHVDHVLDESLDRPLLQLFGGRAPIAT